MADTTLANRTKPIAAPRWLVELTISGEFKRYSSEDMAVTWPAYYGEAYYGETEFGEE